MAKYRVKIKGGLVTVKSKLTRGDKINERELGLFDRQLIRGCFRPKWDGKKMVSYTAPDAIELKKYFQRPMNELMFYEVLAQLLELVKRIEAMGLYRPNVVLNMNLVFVSERSHEVFFIYQPVSTRHASGNVYGFAAEMVTTLEKKKGQDTNFLLPFKQFLADTSKFKLEDMEGFIKDICPHAYSKVITADVGRSGFITNDRVAHKKHYAPDPSGNLETTFLVEDETTLLQEEGTTLLANEPTPTLRRMKNKQEQSITHDSFLIGKDPMCQWRIGDNKAISRRHALIKKQNGSFFLIDQNSTNGSFLNGKALKSGKEERLQNGDSIRLADEEFTISW